MTDKNNPPAITVKQVRDLLDRAKAATGLYDEFYALSVEYLKLHEENARLQTKCNAQASLIKSYDESKGTYKAMYSQCSIDLLSMTAKATTVNSEIAMNAELTEENSRLHGIVERQRAALEKLNLMPASEIGNDIYAYGMSH